MAAISQMVNRAREPREARSERGVERQRPWTRAKGFETFCPLGPFIVPATAVSNPDDLAIRCRVNDEPRQDARTSDMTHSVAMIVAAMSAVCTLEPGDVILTGTPAGVGPLVPGDTVACEIEGLGTLENPVRASDAGH